MTLEAAAGAIQNLAACEWEVKLPSDCSNPVTLEAAAGAIQNLAACEWEVSYRQTVQIP